MVDVTGRDAASTWQTLEVSVGGGVAEVRLARAERLNALDSRMRAELATLKQARGRMEAEAVDPVAWHVRKFGL